MNPQAMENLYNERLNDIEHIISIESNGNDDLKQEGLIGAYKALSTDPEANNRFMSNKAKWSMVSFLPKGRSVDNGFYKRKNLKLIRYNQLPSDDSIFAAAVSNGDRHPVDEQAIFKIDFMRFLEKFSQNERSFIRYKTIDGLSDVCIKRNWVSLSRASGR
jgi:hypothetical protein